VSHRGSTRILSVVIAHLSSLLYRWSLKSTCPVFLPLLYLVRQPRDDDDRNILLIAEDVVGDPSERRSRLVALIVVYGLTIAPLSISVMLPVWVQLATGHPVG
jgi:hypothetical protein